MFERWFTPQESKGIIAVLASLLVGSIVLVLGRSIPAISEDVYIQSESAEDSLYETEGITVSSEGDNAVGMDNIDSNSRPAILPATININSSSLEELQKLPGIGAIKAQAIIDYRESEGGFKSTKDLKNVTGIGPKTYEGLKVYLTIE